MIGPPRRCAALEDDVLGLADVDAAALEAVEHCREDADAVVVAHRDDVRGARLRREVYDVGRTAAVLEEADVRTVSSAIAS